MNPLSITNKVGRPVIVGIALLAAALAVISPGEPTGLSIVDAILRAALAGLVTWTASTAPTPVVIGGVGVLGVAGLTRPLLGIALITAASALAIAELRRLDARPAVAAAVGGIGVLGGFRLGRVGVFGGSALLVGLVGSAIVLTGLAHQSPEVRRVARRTTVIIGAIAGACAVSSGMTFMLAVGHAGDAQRHLRAALEATNNGRLDEATEKLTGAQADISAARGALTAPWGWPGRLLPVIAQHRTVAVDLATDANATVATALEAARSADLDQLTVKDGRADVGKIAALHDPLTTLGTSLTTLREQLATERPGWIVSPLGDRIDRADGDLQQAQRQLANLTEAVRLAPDLLGGTVDRRMLIAFVTPSEARPLGGHMANYGELTISNGHLELSSFGRSSDLIALSADPTTRVISGPLAYLNRYGAFGAGGNGTPAGPDWWLDVTISPDFPSVAQVMAEMYTKATGRAIDNVLTIDPSGLAGLLSITGPIDAKGLPEQLTEDNVVQLLEHDQYALFGRDGREERVEFLGDAGQATFDALIKRRRLDPVVLVKHLAPAVAGNHVMLWSAHPAEQALFGELHATGEFARADEGADALAVTSLNSGANKTDAFLTRQVRYDAVVDDITGAVAGTVTVTLFNDAPTTGLPFHVIGNSVNEPFGSNRTYLTLYRGSGEVTSLDVDGKRVSPATGSELGWRYAEYRHTIAPQGTAIFRYEVTGTVDPTEPYRLWVRAQPMANPEQLTVSVHLASGGLVAAFDGIIDHSMMISGTIKASPTIESTGPAPALG